LKLIALIAVVPIFCGTAPAVAQTRVSVTPYIGLHFASDDRSILSASEAFETELDDGPVTGLRVGFPITGPWGVEVTYGWTAFDFESRVSTIEEPLGILTRERYDVHFLEAGILWTALSDRTVYPFATFAAGVARVDLDIEFAGIDTGEIASDSETVLAAGGGIFLRSSERLRIRVDGRDHVRFCSEICGRDKTLHEFELSGGVEIRL
jgi:hypothetical protein